MQQKAKMSWLCPGLVFGMLLTLAALPAIAGHHEGSDKMAGCGLRAPENGGMMCGPDFEQELNLTAEQKEKVKAGQAAAQKEAISLRAEVKTLHVDLNTEMGKDKPELAAVEKLAKQIGDLKGRMILADAKAKIQFKSVLTPEQKIKMNDMLMKCGPDNKGCPCMKGKCPGMEGKCPCMEGKCPCMEGKCPGMEGKCPGMEGKCPCMEGKCPCMGDKGPQGAKTEK